MRALLFLTAGHTDVQLLLGEQRHELDKDRAGDLHAQLAQRTDWILADAKPKARKSPALCSDDGKTLPTGSFQLCTPKLDAVLHYLDEHDLELAHALILHTDRPPQKRDPAYAGPILQRRLRERGKGEAALVSYLSGATEMLEDTSTAGDEVVRREVVARLDTAIAEAFDHPRGPFDLVVIAALGGMPKVQALVAELAQLRAGSLRIDDLEVADARGDAPERAVRRTSRTDPAVLVAATRHALGLVERGDFIAARGAVAHLEAGGRIAPVFRWLHEWAASIPHAQGHEPPLDFPLPNADQRALSAALRVELALRRGDIARAIQSTFAFFEAAVLDALYRDHIQEVHESQESRMRFKLSPEPTPALKKAFTPVSSAPGLYYINNFGDGAVEICKRYLAAYRPGSPTSTSLLSLADAVSNIKSFRDLVAHGEPNRERLREAKKKMEQLSLWSRNSPDSTQPAAAATILHQPLFTDVLAALAAPSLAQRLDALLAATLTHALATWSRR